MAKTKAEIAGEIYDLNKEAGYKAPFSRKKCIKTMCGKNGFTKKELEELRRDLIKKKKALIESKIKTTKAQKKGGRK